MIANINGGRNGLATVLGCVLPLLCSFPAAHSIAQAATSAPGGEVFARVGEKVITFQEYQAALAAGMRKKFYHARPPVDELSKFQREIGEQLVGRLLLLEEAKLRGIAPERAKIDASIAEYDQRYAASEQWRANREQVLRKLIEQLEHQSVLERLEASVRTAELPAEGEVRAYYEVNPGQFTEPEQLRISLILLKVTPSSPRAAWDEAAEEAKRLHQRLQKGADFAELARTHSSDPSAERGGDLGYVHRGMLPELIEKQVIDSLGPGTYSAPVTLLEGVAIVRLADRRPPQLRAYADVAKRAEELWLRDRGEKAWNQLIATLRAATVVQIDESRFLPAVSN
ncbi:MAG: peptidylprolyl isomerase [Betaproteobacteria bacterium]|nr:peptidylprolyl isomerase [Betaproteobacteria bacterium]